MKDNIFKFNPNNSELKVKKINVKRIIIVSIFLFIIFSILGLLIFYKSNEKFRNFWDYTILRKEVSSEDVRTIVLEKEVSKYVYAYNNKLGILENNNLIIYNSNGIEEDKLNINIIEPIFSNYSNYLTIAENNGNKIYLLKDENILWQKDLEGTIYKAIVNKNGYVAVAVSSLGYKTVIILYSQSGEELFRTYLPTSLCLDIEISNDNKYLAVAEVNSSGTMIETVVKLISVEKARNNPKDAFIGIYNSNSNNIILNLKFTNEGKLVALYDDAIYYVNDQMKKIIDIADNISFIDIESEDKIISISKNKNGFFNTSYVIKIYNYVLNKEVEYVLQDLPKELYVKNNTIVINYGTDIEIVSASTGWLIKKYVSKQDIKKVFIADNFIAVEYNNEIKLINI